MISNFSQKLVTNKDDKIKQGLFRKLTLLSKTESQYNFSSNDYLSLTTDPVVSQFYQEGYRKYPTGSTGSIVISGYSAPHFDLEKYIASILNVDACLVFSSGYLANLSVVSLLSQNGANLIIDKAVHASIYDGIKLNQANYARYLHNDLVSLQKKLSNFSENITVMTESIFSMSGEIADLSAIRSIINRRNADLIVDEAHAFGVIGKQGLGGVVDAGLSQDDVPLRVIPLGKAGAGYGAMVVGQKLWIESLLQTRQAIYSTAVSPAVAYGLLRSIEYIQGLDNKRKKLQDLVVYFIDLQKSSNLKWRDSNSHIQQLQLGCPHLATHVAESLLNFGIICMPIREPTVTKAETGLRIILNCKHEAEHIDYLFACLGRLIS